MIIGGAIVTVTGFVYLSRRLSSTSRSSNPNINPNPSSSANLNPQQNAVASRKTQAVDPVASRNAAAWKRAVLDMMLIIVVLLFVVLILLQEKVVLIAAPGMFMFLRYLLYYTPFAESSSSFAAEFPFQEFLPTVSFRSRRKSMRNASIDEASDVNIQRRSSRNIIAALPGNEEKENKFEIPKEVRNQLEFPDDVKSNTQFTVIPYKFEFVFKHSWDKVSEMRKRQYPDPLRPHILSNALRNDEMEVMLEISAGERAKEICRFLHTELSLPAKVPYIFKSLVGSNVDRFRLDERVIEFPGRRISKLQTVNKDLRNIVITLVIEEFRVHPENPNWTSYEATCAVQFMAVGFFKAQMQGFAEKTFKAEILDKAKHLERILNTPN
jgi:hypothetical protein